MANMLADSVLKFRAVGLYHDLDFKDGQQELGTLFEPLPPGEQSTHTPHRSTWNLYQTWYRKPPAKLQYNKYLTSYTEESKLSLDNTSHEDIPHLEQKLMSLPELTPEK